MHFLSEQCPLPGPPQSLAFLSLFKELRTSTFSLGRANPSNYHLLLGPDHELLCQWSLVPRGIPFKRNTFGAAGEQVLESGRQVLWYHGKQRWTSKQEMKESQR